MRIIVLAVATFNRTDIKKGVCTVNVIIKNPFFDNNIFIIVVADQRQFSSQTAIVSDSAIFRCAGTGTGR